MFQRMKDDLDMVLELDPAAKNRFEVLLTYSGIHAVWAHLVAHWFYKKISNSSPASFQVMRFTGIEIHPERILGADCLSITVWVLSSVKLVTLVTT